MHVVSQGDPAPDDPNFEDDVFCEHQSLSLDTTTRRRISVEVCRILSIRVQDSISENVGHTAVANIISILETTID